MKLPEFNKQVSVKYIKGKQGEVITQGYYQDYAQETANSCLEHAQSTGKFSENGIEKVKFWKDCGYGLTWFDYSGRQIQALNAKTINKTEEIRKIDFYKDFKYTQISSGIEITELPKTPNKLYYICPENIIPSYAGLYYVTKTGKEKSPFYPQRTFKLR